MQVTSPQNHTHVLVHQESCLQGLEIPATEPAVTNLEKRDCGLEHPILGTKIISAFARVKGYSTVPQAME